MSDNRDKSPQEIEAEIEATRAAMRADVDAIGDQVSPDRLKDQAKGVVGDVKDSVMDAIQGVGSQLGDQAGGWSSKAVEVVKANPLPAALIGVGLAWLLMRGTGGETETNPRRITANVQPLPTPSYGTAGVQPTYGSAHYGAGETNLGEPGLQERAEVVRQQASDKVEDAKDAVAQGAYQAKRGFERLLDENPLVLTSAALVLGASLSLLLPGTREEDALMGGARDQLVDNVREKASAAQEVVQETAQQVTQTVKDEAKNQGLTPEAAEEGSTGLIDRAKSVASEAVDTAKETAQEKAREKGLTQSDS